MAAWHWPGQDTLTKMRGKELHRVLTDFSRRRGQVLKPQINLEKFHFAYYLVIYTSSRFCGLYIMGSETWQNIWRNMWLLEEIALKRETRL